MRPSRFTRHTTNRSCCRWDNAPTSHTRHPLADALCAPVYARHDLPYLIIKMGDRPLTPTIGCTTGGVPIVDTRNPAVPRTHA
jgi:hypothetical protein